MNATWWEALETFERIFWLIALPSTLAMLIVLVMTFLGADADADVDIDTEMDTDHGVGVQFFTFKNLIAFFTIFGWTGLACIHNGLGATSTILIATFSGLLMMVIMSSLFYFISRLSYDGTLKLKNAIGHIGETYLTIPGKAVGYGKVQIKIQGALRELEAMTNDEEAIPTGKLIKVIDVTDNNILIVTIN